MTEAEITEMLSTYQPSVDVVDTVRRSKIVLLVGITGAGKNTLKRELLKDETFYDFISHTTREPRTNHGQREVSGVDYFFIDTDEAIRMIKGGEFIEVKKVHSNIYGTAIEGLAPSAKSGKVAVNDVDVQGVEEYKAMSPDVHAVFLLPPSIEKWNERRLARYDGTLDADDNNVRLDSAMKEIKFALDKRYFDFLINDDLQKAADEVRAIVKGNKDQRSHEAAEQLAHKLYEQLSTH